MMKSSILFLDAQKEKRFMVSPSKRAVSSLKWHVPVYCLLLVSSTGMLRASTDTISTPTPGQTITAFVKANEGLAGVVINQAITEKTVRLNPRAMSFVRNYMNRYTLDLIEMKDWGMPYFKMMDQIFIEHGLPVELKYLAVVESRLSPSAVSHAGAVGPWQFMAATARSYGLKVTKYKDERRDYFKSTHAAARYLKALYDEFGDWLLAIAAYNGGPGYVENAIRKSKSRDFWNLQYYLPEESRNHVKKFISTHYIFEGKGGICTLTKDEATEQIGSLAGYLFNRNLTAEELDKASTTTISGKYRAVVIAKYVNMDISEFDRYNPQFDKVMDSEENRYVLKLPPGQMEKFVANKYPILNESVQMLLSDSNATAALLEKKQTAAAIK